MSSIPRNHRVQQALDAAIDFGDFSPFADLLTVCALPLSFVLARLTAPWLSAASSVRQA
jgi:hypothetical protein